MARTRASEGEPLGREEIVAGAMRVTKAVGLDHLTMRALAAELGVTPMALYHHVPNKDALLQLVADAVIGEIDVPPPDVGPWDVRLAALARDLRARVSAFPGVGAYLLGSDVLTPGTDALVTSSVAMLESAGFSSETPRSRSPHSTTTCSDASRWRQASAVRASPSCGPRARRHARTTGRPPARRRVLRLRTRLAPPGIAARE